MESGSLDFGEDCIIKLEDLGELKDYSETMDILKESLQLLSCGKSKDVPKELWEVIEADPEDTYFLPNFQRVLQLIVSIVWKNLLTQLSISKIIGFYFTILEETLLSSTFGQEIIGKLMKEIGQYNKEGFTIQKQILRILYNLSSKVIYIDEIGIIASLWDLVNEQQLFTNYEVKNVDKIAAVYAQCCEKFIRNKEFRKLVTYNSSKPFFTFKSTIWERNKAKFLEVTDKLSSFDYYNSTFLKALCSSLQKQINDLL